MAKTIPATLLGLLCVGGPLTAQEVQWRHDYAAARQEAAETGKPLLLDFGTESCVWCRRLDVTTFRAPAVVETLNTKFIPLKIDGNVHERLSQMMNVTGYPTLVLASPDGKVLGRKDGYIDAMGMAAMLGQALGRVEPATPRPEVTRTPPAPRSREAEILDEAREDFSAGRFLACLDRCEQVRADAAGRPEADEAERLLSRLAADAAAWNRTCDQITARLDALHATIGRDLSR